MGFPKGIALIVLAVIVLFGGVFAYNTYFKNTSNNSQVVSSPSSQAGLANPASENCKRVGGQTVIKKAGDGGEYGVCVFEDNMQCEEWALFRKECPVGGVKITGFDTDAQIYCAISGGQTLAKPNANCTFPNGKVCSNEDLYNGKCSPNSDQLNNPLLDQVKSWAPSNISWQQVMNGVVNLGTGVYYGTSMKGTLTSNLGTVTTLGEQQNLQNMGWKRDINLDAGGPTGGAWGYTKGKELLYFTFQNNSFVPPPQETKCPCNLEIEVFYTNKYL